MIDVLFDKILNLLKKDNVIDETIIDAYRYGLQIMLLNIWGVMLALIIGVLLKAIIETVVFLLLFITTRRFSGGYHANKIWQCSLMTSATFLTIIILYKTIKLSIITNVSVFLISLIIFILFSPVENKNKPLNSKLKKKCKIISCVLLSAQFAIGIFGCILKYKICEIIFLTMLSISIFIVIAKIKERRQNNEKNIRNHSKGILKSG